MLSQHRELFAQYWRWSDDWLQHALQTGVMRTRVRLDLPHRHHRIQRALDPKLADPGDRRRHVADRLHLAARHGIGLLAPVHDAVLIEAPIERIEADVALMQEIMRRASRIVLNADAAGTMSCAPTQKIIRYPDRYTDKRGTEIWTEVTGLLASCSAKRQPWMRHDRDDYAKRRLAELHAAAPAKRKKIVPYAEVKLSEQPPEPSPP